MQEAAPASLSEASGVVTEVDVEGSWLVVGVALVVEADPALVVDPLVADWVVIVRGADVGLVGLRAPGGVAGVLGQLLVDGFLAAGLRFFADQQRVLHAAQLVAAAELHVVECVLLLAFDLDFLDGFEEDAAVALLFGVGELEVGAGFVLVVGVGDFFLSERVNDFAAQHCVVEYFELLGPFNGHAGLVDLDLALFELVAALPDVHLELVGFLHLWKVFGRVDHVHRVVEGVQEGLLDFLGVLLLLGADQRGGHAVPALLEFEFLLRGEERSVELDHDAVGQRVLELLGLEPGQLLVHLVVQHFLLGGFLHLEEGLREAGERARAVDLPETGHGALDELARRRDDFRLDREQAVHDFEDDQLLGADLVFEFLYLLVPDLAAPLALHVAVDAGVVSPAHGFLGLALFLGARGFGGSLRSGAGRAGLGAGCGARGPWRCPGCGCCGRGGGRRGLDVGQELVPAVVLGRLVLLEGSVGRELGFEARLAAFRAEAVAVHLLEHFHRLDDAETRDLADLALLAADRDHEAAVGVDAGARVELVEPHRALAAAHGLDLARIDERLAAHLPLQHAVLEFRLAALLAVDRDCELLALHDFRHRYEVFALHHAHLDRVLDAQLEHPAVLDVVRTEEEVLEVVGVLAQLPEEQAVLALQRRPLDRVAREVHFLQHGRRVALEVGELVAVEVLVRLRVGHDVDEVALELLDHRFSVVVVAELDLARRRHEAPYDRGLEHVEQVVELADVDVADEAAGRRGQERVEAA